MTGLTLRTVLVEAKEVNKPTIVLATGNWEPYYAESIPNGGVVTEIVRSAFQRMGYELEVKWLPWARAINMAKAGHYDGVLGAWYTKERTQFFTYSEPFFENEIVLFKLKDDPFTYKSLGDLKSYRIGVSRNSGPHELLKNELAENLDIVVSADLNIKKLIAKRIDLFADERLGIQYMINTQFPKWREVVEVVKPPLQLNELHILLSKKVENNHKIIGDFNKGLQKLVQDGTFDDLLEKHGFNKGTK